MAHVEAYSNNLISTEPHRCSPTALVALQISSPPRKRVTDASLLNHTIFERSNRSTKEKRKKRKNRQSQRRGEKEEEKKEYFQPLYEILGVSQFPCSFSFLLPPWSAPDCLSGRMFTCHSSLFLPVTFFLSLVFVPCSTENGGVSLSQRL